VMIRREYFFLNVPQVASGTTEILVHSFVAKTPSLRLKPMRLNAIVRIAGKLQLLPKQ
jgi:hypothetical protein